MISMHWDSNLHSKLSNYKSPQVSFSAICSLSFHIGRYQRHIVQSQYTVSVIGQYQSIIPSNQYDRLGSKVKMTSHKCIKAGINEQQTHAGRLLYNREDWMMKFWRSLGLYKHIYGIIKIQVLHMITELWVTYESCKARCFHLTDM